MILGIQSWMIFWRPGSDTEKIENKTQKQDLPRDFQQQTPKNETWVLFFEGGVAVYLLRRRRVGDTTMTDFLNHIWCQQIHIRGYPFQNKHKSPNKERVTASGGDAPT